MHQPYLHMTALFCSEKYLARMFYFFFSEYEFYWYSWTLWPQKRHHFVRICFFAISLYFSQLSFRSNPSFFCLRGESFWKARLTGTSGMALHLELLVVACACVHGRAAAAHSPEQKQPKQRLHGEGKVC